MGGEDAAVVRRLRAEIRSDRSTGVASVADELRRFRHFVRHGYAAPLDWERVRQVAQAWLADQPALRRDLDAFDGFLTKLADRLDRSA